MIVNPIDRGHQRKPVGGIVDICAFNKLTKTVRQGDTDEVWASEAKNTAHTQGACTEHQAFQCGYI